MTRPVNLVEALRDRSRWIIATLAARATASSYPPLGHFEGYRADEGLEGELHEFPDRDGSPGLIVEYWRPGYRDHPSEPRLRLLFPRMTTIDEDSRTPPVITAKGIEERQYIDVEIPAGVRTTREYRVEFERTMSFEAAAKAAWELAAKTSLSVEIAAVKGTAEVSGKYSREYAERHAAGVTQRDTCAETYEFTGPVKTRLEGYRAHNREQCVVTARCDFDHEIALDPGGDHPGIVSWSSFTAEFLPVVRGTAPVEKTWAREFQQHPVTDAELAALTAPSDKLIEFPATYDAVVTRYLRPVKD